MTDVVVTIPRFRWQEWIEEGDLPGESWSGLESFYNMRGPHYPKINPGARVYIVALGKLRGYAPLVRVEHYDRGRYALVRRGHAVAVTIDEPIRGFQGWRYRWWDESAERSYDFAAGLEALAVPS